MVVIPSHYYARFISTPGPLLDWDGIAVPHYIYAHDGSTRVAFLPWHAGAEQEPMDVNAIAKGTLLPVAIREITFLNKDVIGLWASPRYHALQSQSLADLQVQINSKLALGWELSGGITMMREMNTNECTLYSQTMIEP